MNNLSHQIYKYRLLWVSGWAAMIFSVAYSIYYGEWLLLLASFVWTRIVGVFSVQIALHRYFSHRSFETGPGRRRFLLWFSILSGEGSPIAWSTHHRHHHKYSDTERDVHSPHESFWRSALYWQIQPADWWLKTKQVNTITKDLLRDKEVRFVDRHYYTIWLLLVAVSFMIDWRMSVFFVLAPAGWAMFFAMFVNAFSHYKLPGSYRTYDTPDRSYNNQWIHWFIFGEGLHNNHHHMMNSHTQALNPGEFDLAGWICEKLFIIRQSES
jgi:stearoyl-CoA desaturase (delta-9 desaturase)